MILAYCVVGVFIIIVTAYICVNRNEWCVKVKKRKVVKKRVRRDEIFQAPPLQQTIDIGKGK
jgi:hypothetical protein